MSSSTPKNRKAASSKSQSYPGTPQNERKSRINLTEAFSDIESRDATLTAVSQETVYKTAVEQTSQFLEIECNAVAGSGSIQSLQVGRVDSIEEMERLRSQIQFMLNPTSVDSSPDAMNISGTSSIDTIALLKSALPQTSPELQLDDNGILISSLSSNMFSKHLHQTSPALMDSSIVAENTILKENIAKERCRRKHCEEQIHDLQNKLLECQEQLAVAMSTEKKKEIMIEQLDRTLASVVDGWKKQEVGRVNLINQLQNEKEILEISQRKHNEILCQFEYDLAEAVDAFRMEQEKLKTVKLEHKALCDSLEKEIFSLQKQVEELQQANLNLEEEKVDILQVKETLIMERQNITERMKQDSVELELLKENFEEQLQLKEEECKTVLEEHQEALDCAHKESQALHRKLTSMENVNHKLVMETDTIKKEKDTLAMELSLFQSKFDALKTKQDSEMQSKLEEEFNKQIHEIQVQIATTEHELCQSQKKQISELNRKHREELEKQKQRLQQEIKKKEEATWSIQAEYHNELQKAKSEISELSTTGKVLESQRAELMNRIKFMMQQHWQETVSLLGNENKTLVPSSLHSLHHANDQLSSTLQSDFSSHPPTNGHPSKYDFNTGTVSVNPLAADVEIQRHSGQQKYNSMHDGNYYKESGTSQHVDQFNRSGHPNPSIANGFVEHNPHTMYRVNQDPGMQLPKKNSYSQNLNMNQRITYQQNQSLSNQPLHQNKTSSHGGWNEAQQVLYPATPDPGIHTPYQTNMETLPSHQSSNITIHSPIRSGMISQSKQQPQRLLEESHDLSNTQTNAFPQDLQHGKNGSSSVSVKEHDGPISLLYQDLDEDERSIVEAQNVDHKILQQTEKQTQLTHFIEKLLQRSPGLPLEDIHVKERQKDVRSHSIAKNVDRLLQHTPDHQPVNRNTAFRKSVVKSHPSRTTRSEGGSADPQLQSEHQSHLQQIKQLLRSDENINEEQLLFLLMNITNRTSNMENEEKPELQPAKTKHNQSVFERLHRIDVANMRKHPQKNPEPRQDLARKASKTSKINKNIASKEQRRSAGDQRQMNGKTNIAWK